MNSTVTDAPGIDTVGRADRSLAPPRRIVTRTPRDSVAAMPSALASEWTKLRSLRSTPAILGGTAAIGTILVWVLAVFVETDPDTGEVFTLGNSFSFPMWLSTVLAVVTGILMFTSEVQHGTLAGALTAQPARWVTVAAKSVIVAGFGFVLGLTGMIAGVLGGLLGGLDAGDTSGMSTTAAWGVIVTAVAAVFGLGIGLIVRHSAAAVSITLVWIFVIENLVRGFAPPRLYRYLPFHPPNGLLGIETTGDPEALAVAFTRVQDALLFSSYTVAAVTVGTVLLYRRDAN